MTPHKLALPIALLVFGCFEDTPPSTEPNTAETVGTGMPVVPAGGTGDTDSAHDSSSGSSGAGLAEESTGGAQEGSSGPDADARCGDGVINPGETCDDGNPRSGDGCSASCSVEGHACGPGSITLGEDIERGIGVCKDPNGSTCEKDFTTLCAADWHLCSWTEHVQLNDGVFIQLDDVPAVGVIRCRTLGGSGHYTTHDFSVDGPDSCEIGSSRVDCPTNLGCNETALSALCCAPLPSCGNGIVDSELEECDDGNDDDLDACSNDCASRQGSGPFC